MKQATSLPVIAICNRKGGAGKTTAAVNLAAEMAAAGWRVLLLDLDSQGHCALGLGIAVPAHAVTAHSIFLDDAARLIDAVIDSRWPNLALAPANQLFEHGSGRRDQLCLARALSDAAIHECFDLVIIDTPPSLDFLLLNALCAANWVLVPYLPHPLSFEGIRQLMRILFQVMSAHNPDLKILGFLPMTAAQHILEHRRINKDIAHQFGAHRVLAGIRNDIRLAESFGAGQPLRYYAGSTRAAQDFRTLAESLSAFFTVQLGARN